MAGVCNEQGQGVGEDEHGLGPELPGPAPGHPLQRPGGEHRDGAQEDGGVPGIIRDSGEHGLRHEAQGGDLQEEEEEREPEEARVQLLPDFCHKQEKEPGDAVRQGDKPKMNKQGSQEKAKKTNFLDSYI